MPSATRRTTQAGQVRVAAGAQGCERSAAALPAAGGALCSPRQEKFSGTGQGASKQRTTPACHWPSTALLAAGRLLWHWAKGEEHPATAACSPPLLAAAAAAAPPACPTVLPNRGWLTAALLLYRNLLQDDIRNIEMGRVALPNYPVPHEALSVVRVVRAGAAPNQRLPQPMAAAQGQPAGRRLGSRATLARGGLSWRPFGEAWLLQFARFAPLLRAHAGSAPAAAAAAGCAAGAAAEEGQGAGHGAAQGHPVDRGGAPPVPHGAKILRAWPARGAGPGQGRAGQGGTEQGRRG